MSFDQKDGVAMGENLFMGHHEEISLNNYLFSQVLFYRRYFDDTFCLFHRGNDSLLFLTTLTLGTIIYISR